MHLSGKIKDKNDDIFEKELAEGHHEIPKLWVVAASKEKARFFTRHQRSLHEIGKAEAKELGFEKDGNEHVGSNANSSLSGANRHSLAPSSEPGEIEAERFARELADYLDNEAQKDSFDELIIFSGAQFTGLLRDKIKPGMQAKIRETVTKDVINEPLSDIEDHLGKVANL